MAKTEEESKQEDADEAERGLPIPWTSSAFFRTHAPRLEALIRSRVSPRFRARFDAEDIVQSAFRSFFVRPAVSSAAGSLHYGIGVGDMWPLLAEIAVRKLSQQIRRHSAQRRSVVADVAPEAEIASSDAGPDDEACLNEVIAMSKARLDEAPRRAFALRLDGFEILEIAEQLEISERTVRRYLSEVKQILQRLLDFEPALPPATASGVVSRTNLLPTDLKFNAYVLRQWIGEGAVGKVYRATEKQSGRTVAVKFLKKAFRFHSLAGDSFRNEVQIVSRLQHPGIIRLEGMGKTPNQGDFLVMEWAPGGDLACRAAACRPSLYDIRQWSMELIDGLEHAHNQGYIHGDLKPSNVLIDAVGRLRICDFGFARQFVGRDCGNQSHKQDQIRGGTPAFIAPEMVERSWGAVGPWTDVFGLGAILFSLFTSQPVHDGPTFEAILANVMGPPSTQWPRWPEHGVPDPWRSVCNRLLAKQTSHRPQDMAAARKLIEAIAESD